MTNLECLEHLIPKDGGATCCQEAVAQLRRALEALDAVEVLDKWSAPEGDGLSWETECYNDEQKWACVLKGYDIVSYLGGDPHAARIAAAAAVKGGK